MLISKETLTRLTDDGRVVGEIVTSGDQAIVRMFSSDRPLEVSVSEWQQFVQTVKQIDRHVVAPTGSPTAAPGRAPRVRRKRSTSERAAAPVEMKVEEVMKGQRAWVPIVVRDTRVRLGKRALMVLRKLAAEPTRWWIPRQLAMGRVADTCWSLTALGLLERNVPLRSGMGARGQYKLSAFGQEVMEKVNQR